MPAKPRIPLKTDRSPEQKGTKMAEIKQQGILYIVSVPIGNYADMTQRAREILEQVDFIASEDTRRSAILMHNLNIEINNRLISNHKFNEYAKTRYFINDLMDGKSVAIITDAGTPCISDPGNELIKEAIRNGIRVSPVPGCCAAIAALTVSGFDLSSFAFYGFIPRDRAGKQKIMQQIMRNTAINTCVFYESPKRIVSTVSFFAEEDIRCEMCLCNDLTKYYEYMYRGTPAEVLEELNQRGTAEKGEYVLVIQMNRTKDEKRPEESLSPEALLIETMIRNGCSVKEAIKQLAGDPGCAYNKNMLYDASLRLKELL